MYSLRQATHEDYDFLYRLHVQSMRLYIEATWGWQEAWQHEYFALKFDPQKRQVIQVDGQDAGTLVVEERDGDVYLALIELLPAFQNRRVGTAILTDLLRRAQVCHKPVALHVLKTNEPARLFYERLGFEIVAEEEIRYKMRWLPANA